MSRRESSGPGRHCGDQAVVHRSRRGVAVGFVVLALVASMAGVPGAALADGPQPISREALALAAREADPEGTGGPPGALPGVDVEEKLGALVPADLVFVDERGEQVRLGELFAGDKPTLLILAYYRCPVLCGALLRGVTNAVTQLGWTPGDNFRLVTLSIDPKDTPLEAGRKKESVLGLFEKASDGGDWPFLVGEQSQIDALTDALGFRYVYDERIDQYVHPAVSVVLGPNGLVSRYVYGIEPRPLDLRLALLEAGEGKVGTAFERFILSCYRYDPVSRKYVNWTFRFIRVGAFGIMLAVGLLLTRMWRREGKGGHA